MVFSSDPGHEEIILLSPALPWSSVCVGRGGAVSFMGGRGRGVAPVGGNHALGLGVASRALRQMCVCVWQLVVGEPLL